MNKNKNKSKRILISCINGKFIPYFEKVNNIKFSTDLYKNYWNSMVNNDSYKILQEKYSKFYKDSNKKIHITSSRKDIEKNTLIHLSMNLENKDKNDTKDLIECYRINSFNMGFNYEFNYICNRKYWFNINPLIFFNEEYKNNKIKYNFYDVPSKYVYCINNFIIFSPYILWREISNNKEKKIYMFVENSYDYNLELVLHPARYMDIYNLIHYRSEYYNRHNELLELLK